MKILFDQGTPVPLRHALAPHVVSTAYEMGWSQLKNGDLLKRAETSAFDVLVTTDHNLRYQQNMSARRMAVVTLWTTSWRKLQRHLPKITFAIDTIHPGDFIEIRADDD